MSILKCSILLVLVNRKPILSSISKLLNECFGEMLCGFALIAYDCNVTLLVEYRMRANGSNLSIPCGFLDRDLTFRTLNRIGEFVWFLLLLLSHVITLIL